MQFKDPKSKIDAQGILKEGMKTPFWKMISEALQESKDALARAQDGDQTLRELPPDQYKLESELYRIKRDFLSTLMKTPENLMSWLESPNNNDTEFDPYGKSTDV